MENEIKNLGELIDTGLIKEHPDESEVINVLFIKLKVFTLDQLCNSIEKLREIDIETSQIISELYLRNPKEYIRLYSLAGLL